MIGLPASLLAAGAGALIVKTTAVTGLGLLLWLSLKQASASARHLVLGATFAAALLVPLVSLLAPPLELVIPGAAPPAATEFEATISAAAQSGSMPTENATQAPQIVPARSHLFTQGLVVVYLAGVILFVLHLGAGLVRIGWLTRKARRPAQYRHWILPQKRTATPSLLISDRLAAPLTWGALNPAILMPATAETWSALDRHNAILHELAHVERRDWLVQMLATVACAVYWFNPLVWLARRQLVLEAELAADDRVLASGSPAADYAQQLVNLAQQPSRARPHLAATTMAEKALLSRRVESILNPEESRMPLTELRKSLLLAVVSISALLIGTTRLVAAPQDAAPAASDIPETVSTPLIRAAAGGDNEAVARLIRSGADVNETWEGRRTQDENRGDRGVSERDKYGLHRSALTTAASRGHLEVVRTLLDAGAPVDRVVDGDATPLIVAAGNNHIEVTRLLIERGADVNKAVRGDGSPLIAAARANNVDAIRIMLERGADPNLEVRGDENPLYHAITNGNAEAVRLLLDAGVPVDQEWRGDGTPLIVAARTGDPDTIEALMLAGARPDQGVSGDGNAMIVAAKRGDNDLLRKMLESGADANAAVQGDGSPLIQAARNRNMEGVVLLLQAGADIDLVVKGDENALIGAAWNGDVEMVDYLLKAGADPNIRARAFGEVRTALRQARQEGHDEVVRLLVAAGATE